MNQPPPRQLLALTALWFALLVALFARVLVPDPDNSAYLWLRISGFVMAPPAVACALAAAVPGLLARQSLWLAAQGMLLLSAGLGVLLLLSGLALGLVQGAGDGTLPAVYAGALVLLAATLYAFWFRLRRATAQA